MRFFAKGLIFFTILNILQSCSAKTLPAVSDDSKAIPEKGHVFGTLVKNVKSSSSLTLPSWKFTLTDLSGNNIQEYIFEFTNIELTRRFDSNSWWKVVNILKSNPYTSDKHITPIAYHLKEDFLQIELNPYISHGSRLIWGEIKNNEFIGFYKRDTYYTSIQKNQVKEPIKNKAKPNVKPQNTIDLDKEKHSISEQLNIIKDIDSYKYNWYENYSLFKNLIKTKELLNLTNIRYKDDFGSEEYIEVLGYNHNIDKSVNKQIISDMKRAKIDFIRSDNQYILFELSNNIYKQQYHILFSLVYLYDDISKIGGLELCTAKLIAQKKHIECYIQLHENWIINITKYIPK